MVLAALLAVMATVALAVSLAWGANDQQELAEVVRQNCVQIEALKAVLRPELFDEAEMRRILSDLALDPATTERLIESARRNNARERRELAPLEC